MSSPSLLLSLERAGLEPVEIERLLAAGASTDLSDRDLERVAGGKEGGPFHDGNPPVRFDLSSLRD